MHYFGLSYFSILLFVGWSVHFYKNWPHGDTSHDTWEEILGSVAAKKPLLSFYHFMAEGGDLFTPRPQNSKQLFNGHENQWGEKDRCNFPVRRHFDSTFFGTRYSSKQWSSSIGEICFWKPMHFVSWVNRVSWGPFKPAMIKDSRYFTSSVVKIISTGFPEKSRYHPIRNLILKMKCIDRSVITSWSRLLQLFCDKIRDSIFTSHE